MYIKLVLFRKNRMFSKTYIKFWPRTKQLFKLKYDLYKYVLAIMLVVNSGISSAMPFKPVQIYSASNSEERTPIETSVTSIQPSSTVGDLLTSLFRQTIYNRIENLLLDPGRHSLEKQNIVDSAVQNYHDQQYSAPPHTNQQINIDSNTPTSSSTFSSKESSVKVPRSNDEEYSVILPKNVQEHQVVDISTLAGKSFLTHVIISDHTCIML